MTFIKLHIGYYPEWDRSGLTVVLLGFWFGIARDSFPPNHWNVLFACEWCGWRYKRIAL